MKILHENSSFKMTCRAHKWPKGDRAFHWHEKIEIVKCLNGSFDALIDGKKYTINKNDIMVIGEGIIHQFSFYNDKAETVILQFPYKSLFSSGIVPVLIEPVITAKEISKIENLEFEIYSLLKIAEKEKEVNLEASNSFMEHLCIALYCKLMEHFPQKETEKTVNKGRQEFYEIVKYVNEHFTDNITVASIADEFYSDRTKISRLFLKYSGITLNSYINSLRMNMALKLIENGVKITEAALESGFQTIRTFNNIRNKMGIGK